MRSGLHVACVIGVSLIVAGCGRDREGGDGGDDAPGDASLVCSPDCPPDKVCSMGVCKSPCEASEDSPSNLGCDFWAADLDNESSSGGFFNSDAAAQQYSIVVANNNNQPAAVTVTMNTARIGQPVNEVVVASVMAAAKSATRIDLPQREVDGSMGQNGTYTPNSGSGSFVSPHAYHIRSELPVVVYQFNPIIQQYSNDASTLIPKQAMGSDYIIVGYETANPCSLAGLPGPAGVPDHGAITIIPLEDQTQVTITASHAIKASAGDSGIAIPATPKGGMLTLTLDRFNTANLETQMAENVSFGGCTAAVMGGQDGDFTGTYIKSNKPVAVFTSNERGIGFGGATNVEYPPGWVQSGEDADSICCTDHLEEQLFPVTALGKEFALARSPVRSTHPTWLEPDIFRVVGTVNNTNITTNLPPPYNQFTVNARADVTFAATKGFTLVSDQPIQIASYLVPQHFVKYGFIGDPSQILHPAAEQHRKDYVFLVPSTFTSNYAVLAKPVSSTVTMDLQTLSEQCVHAPLGPISGVEYEQVTCPISEGQHTVESQERFGLSVYGYYNVGSYSFVGGSDVKIINPIL